MTKWLGGIAAAALLATSASALAADLGGSCCADLEERVAELEAVTTRKGNRKVRLSISGYVSHSVMHWDDGGQKNVYIGDGGMNSSRFRLTGEATISPDLTAGFTYEFGIHENALGKMDQGATLTKKGFVPGTGGDDLGGDVLLRDSTVWIKHKTLGKVKIGHGSTATDNLIFTDVSNAGVAASSDVALWNGGFLLRSEAAKGALVPMTWSNVLNQGVSFDTARRNHVSYQSPTLAGFFVEGAVAEDDFWDVAAKFAGEFSGFRVAAAAGYAVDKEAPAFNALTPLGFSGLESTDLKTATAALSVMHMPSGVFATVSGGQREVGWSASGFGWDLSAKDATMWHVIAGWQKNVTGWGASTIYGEYHEAKDMVGFDASKGTSFASVSSKANVVGFGVIQSIDAAALDIFLSYKRYSADVDLTSNMKNVSGSLDPKDFSAVIGGVKISF